MLRETRVIQLWRLDVFLSISDSVTYFHHFKQVSLEPSQLTTPSRTQSIY